MIQVFGTEEYGNRENFKIVCNKCGKEARIVPIHYYKETGLEKIVLEIRHTCLNKYGATIHKNN